ncbi:MAG: hypothetical protein ACOH5I_04490 [Oligoflexus sp.]
MVNLFKMLRKSFTPKASEASGNAAINKADLRLHPRYTLASLDIFYLLDPNSAPIPIQDISYGGVAIANRDRPQYWLQTSAISLEIKALTRSCRTILMPIHKSSSHIGYAFIHDDIACLEFLRPILEDLRLGYTLQPIAEQWRKEQYQGKDWHMLRGDGPVDLLFRLSPHDAKLLDMMMTIRQNQIYHELRYENERWRTLESMPEPGVAVRMHETPSFNTSTLERCIYILTGANSRFAHPAIIAAISSLILELKRQLNHNISA